MTAVLKAFGLREEPFGVTPDPRYLYLSVAHREALASLIHGIDSGRGFMALIADPGMGKTTLLFRLLQHYSETAQTAFVFQTQCTPRELLQFLLADLGMEATTNDIVSMHQQFNKALLHESRRGRPFIVIVDEAQNLSDEALETVRLLSDFETPSRKLVQIILAGQKQLAAKLGAPHLAQLRQRISLLCKLHPLTHNEVSAYIEHRMQTAGFEGVLPFTPHALEEIADRSGGVPRLINNYCFHGLSMAAATNSEVVELAMVREVARDLDVDNWDPLSLGIVAQADPVVPVVPKKPAESMPPVDVSEPAVAHATRSSVLTMPSPRSREFRAAAFPWLPREEEGALARAVAEPPPPSLFQVAAAVSESAPLRLETGDVSATLTSSGVFEMTAPPPRKVLSDEDALESWEPWRARLAADGGPQFQSASRWSWLQQAAWIVGVLAIAITAALILMKPRPTSSAPALENPAAAVAQAPSEGDHEQAPQSAPHVKKKPGRTPSANR